ncbi:MAG: metallophosphoesterase [Planctomycetota bacterium]
MPRIVQISDLHLTEDRSGRAWRTDTWTAFDRVLEALRSEDFDRLVLTGDLANKPRRATYERLREALGAALTSTHLVPGNHDSSVLVREVFGDRLCGDRPTSNFSASLGEWQLIGLDSTVPRRVHGRISDEQIEWLRGELAEPRPTLLFQHHPPIRVGTWWLDKDLAPDLRAYSAAVGSSTVRGIACGHVHQSHAGTLAGVPVWTAPSTAYQFPPRGWWPRAASRRSGYRCFELDGDALRTHVVML